MKTFLRYLRSLTRRSAGASASFCAPRQIVLRANELWRPGSLEKLPIHCVRGKVWITTAGEPADVILDAGRDWAPAQNTATLVSALSDAVLCIGGGRGR